MALHRPSNGPWTKRPLPEKRTMSRGPPPPHKVHLAPMGLPNYPRRHSKLEVPTNLPGGLPSYKSYDTGAGFSKKPTVVVGQEGPLGDLGSRNASGPPELLESSPADFQKRINDLGADLSRLNIGNTLLTLGTGAWPEERIEIHSMTQA